MHDGLRLEKDFLAEYFRVQVACSGIVVFLADVE